jgi:hypothetical protein
LLIDFGSGAPGESTHGSNGGSVNQPRASLGREVGQRRFERGPFSRGLVLFQSLASANLEDVPDRTVQALFEHRLRESTDFIAL